MKINIANIISVPDAEQIVPAEVDRRTFGIHGREVPIHKKQPFDIRLTNNNNKQLMISCETSLELMAPCDRCLEDVIVPVFVSAERQIPLQEGIIVSEGNEENAYLEEQMLDVDRLIYDEILVNWPTKVLCRDDCKGICPVCGQNLNQGSCDCGSQILDPRMARFQDIFQEFKEV